MIMPASLPGHGRGAGRKARHLHTNPVCRLACRSLSKEDSPLWLNVQIQKALALRITAQRLSRPWSKLKSVLVGTVNSPARNGSVFGIGGFESRI